MSYNNHKKHTSHKPSCMILGVKVNTHLTKHDIFLEIENTITHGVSPSIICTTNPEFILAAQEDEEFKAIINSSLLSIPDGHGVYLAAEYLKHVENSKTSFDTSALGSLKKLFFGLTLGIRLSFFNRNEPYTFPGADLIYDICAYAEKNNLSVALVGGWPKNFLGRMLKTDRDLAKEVAVSLSSQYPNLRVVYASSQYSSKPKGDKAFLEELHASMKESNDSTVDILIAAYTQGDQEKWLLRVMPLLPAKIGIGLGGSFDFVSNSVPRAPMWCRKIHLEWLYRLVIQPWRFRRVFDATVKFPLKVFLNTP